MADIWSDIDAGTPFNLVDCQIALRSGEGTHGTAEDVPSITSVAVTPDVVSAMLEGDGQITSSSSFAQRATGTMTFGGISIDMWAIITGTTKLSGGTTPNQYEALAIVSAGTCFPYFGVIGKATTDNCTGDVQVWMSKVKIESIGEVSLGKGTYVQATINFSALADGTTYPAVQWITHETAVSVTIPPTYIA